jgi:hypothetical protein
MIDLDFIELSQETVDTIRIILMILLIYAVLAALRGNTEIVQFLINRGADRNFATAQGKIAKDFAEKGIAEHPTKVAEYQKILSIL